MQTSKKEKTIWKQAKTIKTYKQLIKAELTKTIF